MNLIGRITGIITNPRETVQDISENSHIEDAVLIVGTFAILSAIFGYISQNIIIFEFIGMDQGSSSYSAASGSSVFSIIIGFISVIIGWIIVSGIVHLFSIVLGGEGSFKKVLMIYSYANIPLLLGTVVNLILISLMSPKNLVFDFSTVSQYNIRYYGNKHESTYVRSILSGYFCHQSRGEFVDHRSGNSGY